MLAPPIQNYILLLSFVSFLFVSCQSKLIQNNRKITPPAFHAQELKGATYVGMSTCATCHDKQNQQFKKKKKNHNKKKS